MLRKPKPVKQKSATDEAVKAALDSAKKADVDHSASDDETGLDPADIQLIMAGALDGKCARSMVSYSISTMLCVCSRHASFV